jgi:CubicO group peptidase (beta-lactamase class C family)
MPPGEFISYSNHGYTLLGYIVELISGIPFDQYVDQNVLKPLGMTRSSFHQPPRSNLLSEMAVGYVFRDGIYQPVPLDYVNDAPAGALTTATDMARFMIVHLEDGRLGDIRVMDGATTAEMHRQHFTPHPKLPGICYGLWEYFANNQRAIQHDGGWTGFYSLLFLLPEHHLGFFVASNSLDLQDSSQQSLGEELTRRFLNRYYPAEATVRSAVPT